jgi:hypothetical protein
MIAFPLIAAKGKNQPLKGYFLSRKEKIFMSKCL